MLGKIDSEYRGNSEGPLAGARAPFKKLLKTILTGESNYVLFGISQIAN
jgi:hypothetical protein